MATLATAGMLDPSLTAQDLLDIGYGVCADYKNGASWNDEVDALIAMGIRNGASMVFATAASVNLCPDDAPPLGE